MAGKKDIVEQALKLVTGAAEESAPRIKLRSHDNRPDWDKIMRDIDSQTNPHPFSDRERVFNNRSTFEIRPFENSLHLGDIRALQPNQGAGTELLDFLKGIADKHGVPITGTAKAYHSGSGYIADTDKLADWYRRRGFEIGDGYPEDGYDIIYNPRKQKFSGGRIAKGPGGIIDDVVSMAGKLVAGEGEQAAKTGIRAYQGSPHDFAAERLVRFPDGRTEYLVGQPDVLPDVPQGAEVLQDFPLGRMRMDKIGTGEGAQAYGHGLYLAEHEPVAKGYRRALSGPESMGTVTFDGRTLIDKGSPAEAWNDPSLNIIGDLHARDLTPDLLNYGSVPDAISGFRSKSKDYANRVDAIKDEKLRDITDRGAKAYSDMADFLEANPDRYNVKIPGHMYEVNINADPNAFLDWDKPLSEQPEAVRQALAKFDPDMYSPESADYDPTELGQIAYHRMFHDTRKKIGPNQGAKTYQAEISKNLAEAGIPGIKYLDAGSRSAGDGTRNYVVFDDKLISIIRKYGIAGASAMLGYNLMENLDSKQALAATMADREYKESRPKQAEGGSVEDEDSWLDAAMTVARNAADKATFGTSKYAAAGADYLTDAALDALGYENDADFDRALAEQEYAMKEGEEKNPAAAGAGDIIGYVAPYLAIGPAEGALTTLGYLSDYGGKVGKTGSLFARALGFADGGEVPEQGYLESVGDAINSAANPIRRVVGVRTVDLPEGMSEVDYGQLLNLAADILNRSMIGFSGADPYAKRPMKMPVSPKGKIVDRVPQDEDDDVNDALRIAKDAGGSTPVLMEDAKGNKYDVNGNIIPPTVTGPNPARSDATPQELGQKAAQDPVMFDEMMRRFAVPDRDIAEYEALRSEVAKQPQAVQQMTHIGAKPRREVTVDMPLLGGEYNLGTAPYDVASGLSGMAQTAYDLKTAPLYMTPFTAPIGAGLDVAEGVATGDPVQASLAALGAPGKFAKAAVIGGSNYLMSPAEAQAGPERWFSKAMKIAQDIPMNKMTGEQALAMLRKGTSPEELRWMGANDFLAGKKSVTKDELIDYLSKNRVKTENVVLADRSSKYPYKSAEGWQNAIDRAEQAGNWDEAQRLTQAWEEYEGVGGFGSPKFKKYSTKGGEDYRETLITLPNGWKEYNSFVDAMRQKYGPGGLSNLPLTSSERSTLDRLMDFAGDDKPAYNERHWERNDVLAHIRSQILDATPEGANRPFKAWNGDEFQSKWGQAGRDEGFATPEAIIKAREEDAKIAQLQKQYGEVLNGHFSKLKEIDDWANEQVGPMPPVSDRMGRQMWLDEKNRIVRSHPEYDAEYNAASEARRTLDDLNRRSFALESSISRIKEAPYITSTEGWTDLTLKKALDQAIDSGSDYFTWTPGEVHAQRYNLGEYVSELHRAGSDLVGFDKNGKQVFTKTGITKEELPKYIGKELAQKLDEAPVEDGWRILTDLNEMVGGQGMIEYYNKIVPKRLEEIIRKATGKKPKIEVITVQTGDGPRQQFAVRIDEDLLNARFSDFNKGGRVTGGNSYGNDQSIANALALTREY